VTAFHTSLARSGANLPESVTCIFSILSPWCHSFDFCRAVTERRTVNMSSPVFTSNIDASR
jgi:hypothetical protein